MKLRTPFRSSSSSSTSYLSSSPALLLFLPLFVSSLLPHHATSPFPLPLPVASALHLGSQCWIWRNNTYHLPWGSKLRNDTYECIFQLPEARFSRKEWPQPRLCSRTDVEVFGKGRHWRHKHLCYYACEECLGIGWRWGGQGVYCAAAGTGQACAWGYRPAAEDMPRDQKYDFNAIPGAEDWDAVAVRRIPMEIGAGTSEGAGPDDWSEIITLGYIEEPAGAPDGPWKHVPRFYEDGSPQSGDGRPSDDPAVALRPPGNAGQGGRRLPGHGGHGGRRPPDHDRQD